MIKAPLGMQPVALSIESRKKKAESAARDNVCKNFLVKRDTPGMAYHIHQPFLSCRDPVAAPHPGSKACVLREIAAV